MTLSQVYAELMRRPRIVSSLNADAEIMHLEQLGLATVYLTGSQGTRMAAMRNPHIQNFFSNLDQRLERYYDETSDSLRAGE